MRFNFRRKKEFNMIRYLTFISLIISMTGCKTNNFNFLKNKNDIPIRNIQLEKSSYPKSGYIFPKENETIYDLANRYNILPQSIIKFNNLKKPYIISSNKKVYLPYPLIHNVKKDENIFDLSMIYAVSQSDIVELNDLKKPFKLELNMKVKIPVEKDYTVIGLDNKVRIKNFYEKSKRNNIMKNKIIESKFFWPTNGRIVKNFGSFDNGKQHNDGINIKVFENKPVLASREGKVAFVGSNLKSFGNMILIKHDKVWVTAYARVTEFNVSEGDFVKKGDVIGNIAKDTILHFQIRKSRNPVNPINYLN